MANILVKNSQLNKETISALNGLIEMDINANSAFRLTRIIKELSSIIDDKVNMEKRILEKWVQKDDFGNPVQANDEQGNPIPGAVNIINMQEFSNEMNDLLSVENTLSYTKLNFEDLSLSSTAKVKDLMKLEFLFN